MYVFTIPSETWALHKVVHQNDWPLLREFNVHPRVVLIIFFAAISKCSGRLCEDNKNFNRENSIHY